jgi:hypothetical protein
MADIIRTLSSWLGKRPSPNADEGANEYSGESAKTPGVPDKTSATTSHQALPTSEDSLDSAEPGAAPDRLPIALSSTQLDSWDEDSLRQFISTQDERSAMRILTSLEDPARQLRVVQAIEDTATLKRISRSSLDKKLKRAADKKLRETDTSDTEQKLKKVVPLNEQLRAFFATPRWVNGDALLRAAEAPDLIEGAFDPSHPIYVDFQELKARLEQLLRSYDEAGEELSSICARLESASRPSQAERRQLQDRWQELISKYSPPRDPGVVGRYEAALSAAAQPRPKQHPQARHSTNTDRAAASETDPARQAEAARVAEEEAGKRREQHEKKEALKEEERLVRARQLEQLFARLGKVEARLAHLSSRQELREIQNQAGQLRRWKREFPEKLEELETKLKELTTHRTEVVKEAQWDTWARTDRASRIQAELEASIGSLETETDADAALRNSVGLSEKLREYANEMRALGGLRRDRDQKIWEKFKALSDRGWLVVDRLRSLLFHQATVTFAQHSVHPLNSEHPLQFKASAFEGEIPAIVRELRLRWIEIGAKPTEVNRAQEEAFNKLFETYSRQLNLSLGRKQRSETAAIQGARDILHEMRSCAEGKATLPSRASVAKTLEEKWKHTSLPASQEAQLRGEWDAYRASLDAQLSEESRKQTEQASSIADRLAAVLNALRDGSGVGMNQSRKAVSELESELAALDKQTNLLKAFTPEAAPLREARDRAAGLVQEYKNALTQETQARARERDQVLEEATRLATSAGAGDSSDWQAANARIEELKAQWKKVGVLGQKQDALAAKLFENLCASFQSRFAAREKPVDTAAQEKSLKARRDVIFSLEAILKFRGKAMASPWSDADMGSNTSSKLLEFGMRYKQMLSMDPARATTQETLKLMDQWSKLGGAADASLWRYYLDRVRALLEL